MNILLLTSYSPFTEVTGPLAAGAEIAMRRIAEKLAERGHNVHFLTFADNIEDDFLINGVYVHIRNRKLAALKQGNYLESSLRRSLKWLDQLVQRRLPKQKQRIIRSYINSAIVNLNHHSWNYKKYICQVSRKFDIDIIHCFSSIPDSLATAMVSNKLKIPFVIRMGGRYWYLKYQSFKDECKKAKYVEFIKYVFDNTACLAFNSKVLLNETSKMFAEVGIQNNCSQTLIDIGVTIPDVSNIDTSFLGQHKPDGDLNAVCVGKFKTNSKRQDLLIKAVSLLKDRAKIKVFFAGDGPTIGEMKELVSKKNLTEQVIFLGNISHEHVFKLIEICDVFVHPTEFEGSSKAVAEAMLCKKPVVVSDIPPLREHISNLENGLLAANDPEGFADKLHYLLSNKAEILQLGTNAKNYAEKHFNPDTCVLDYEKLFENIIANRTIRLLPKNKEQQVEKQVENFN